MYALGKRGRVSGMGSGGCLERGLGDWRVCRMCMGCGAADPGPGVKGSRFRGFNLGCWDTGGRCVGVWVLGCWVFVRGLRSGLGLEGWIGRLRKVACWGGRAVISSGVVGLAVGLVYEVRYDYEAVSVGDVW
ncbi:hypothetical protein K491DRAFT_299151 [Lophiostoma macrostomum CBS 122681]|uniref:Uncharacterized protein n=1 Tax=Lophiostoma macrostomum CBS 122681 TaxID=1314788 RepID=A0A6A6SIF3_9PLEO|nr:hypothetical protein K491DRAFT_299151 [Lophiostoma macrostomum CBS 122681]